MTDSLLFLQWEPVCLPSTGATIGNARDRELKYIHAAANSCMAVVLMSRWETSQWLQIKLSESESPVLTWHESARESRCDSCVVESLRSS